MTHSYAWHDSSISLTRAIYIRDSTRGFAVKVLALNVLTQCDMTHSYVWHDSSICTLYIVTWLIHMFGMTHLYAHIHRDMTHSYVWHDSCICMTPWLDSQMRVQVLRSQCTDLMWHNSFICVTWPIHICDSTHRFAFKVFALNVLTQCDMTHSYVWHDSCICMPHLHAWFDLQIRVQGLRSLCTYTTWHDSSIRVTWPIHIRDSTHRFAFKVFTVNVLTLYDMTHSYVWHDSCMCMPHLHAWLDSQIRVQGLHSQCTYTAWAPAASWDWSASWMCISKSYSAWLQCATSASACSVCTTPFPTRTRTTVTSPLLLQGLPLHTHTHTHTHTYTHTHTHTHTQTHTHTHTHTHTLTHTHTHDVSECYTLRVYHPIPNTYQNTSHRTHKSIWINKSLVNPKSTSNQSSKPCTVLQYPSRKEH